MVSTGKRRTSMDELMVLCKNHHAQEHYRLKVDGFERDE